MDKFTHGLNTEQAIAVNANHKLVVVRAGAGSGKTKVLINHSARLLNENKRVLLTTFTRAARKEMANRIHEYKDINLNNIDIYTLNAIAWRIANFPKLTSLSEHERIFSKFIKKELTQLEINNLYDIVNVFTKDIDILILTNDSYDNEVNARKLKKIFSIINRYQSNNIFNNDSNIEPILGKVVELWSEYIQKNNIYNSTTIFKLAISLLEQNKVEGYKYDNILVDEAQDLNYLQYHFISLLGKDKNIFIVGDQDQSIYGFRASINGFMSPLFSYDKFEENDVLKIDLIKNYRSTQQILTPALNSVNSIQYRYDKKILISDRQGENVSIIKYKTETMEAKNIVNQISTLLTNGCEPSEIAVLTRNNKDLNPIISELYRKKIPYIQSNNNFMNRPEVILIESFINILINPMDLASANIIYRAIYKAKEDIPENHNYGSAFNAMIELSGKGKIAKNKSEIFLFLSKLYENNMSSNYILQYFIQKFNIISTFGKKKEYRFLQHSIEELMLMSLSSESLIDLLILLDERRNEIEGGNKHDNNIYLGTIFSSKGLEFKNVFLPSLTLGSFPNFSLINSSNSDCDSDLVSDYRYAKEYNGDMDEEKRILYVAITRAKDNCFISYSEKGGSGKFSYNKTPSPLLYNLQLKMKN